MKRMMDSDGVIEPLKAVLDRIFGKDKDEEDEKKRKFSTG